jgi:hypothetical protein
LKQKHAKSEATKRKKIIMHKDNKCKPQVEAETKQNKTK